MRIDPGGTQIPHQDQQPPPAARDSTVTLRQVAVRGLADRYGLRVHMDGARLMNGAVAQDVEPAQITQHCDSVSLCFSKVCSRGEGVPGARWDLHKLSIQQLNSPLCSVNLVAVETNIVMVSIRGGWPSPAELCEHLWAVSEEELAETGQAVSVLLFPWSAHTVRAVWHRDISARDTELAKNKLEFVARKCQEKLALGQRPTPPSAGAA
ncbi:PREDICTED: probable low-specificity L-threonine aldolase 2 [Charadrius vociferus]|uniref:probable low-specificity L-threonine aldolase 2 n=1 Tax=Charadrius vociferus TaxID=50402 RepID=UPI000521ABFE|nr:PREDICTED: probable low-specificity L-threonine aldolase 2 [Charadrius vociferus]